MALALFAAVSGTLDVGKFRHIETDFVVHDFEQRDVRRTEAGDVSDERAVHAAAAGIELAHAARDKIDQNVGVANLLLGLFAEFRVQAFLFKNKPVSV